MICMIAKRLLPPLIAAWLAVPAMASGFEPVTDRQSFVALVSGKSLTRLGIRLNVTPDGQIRGRAFGATVTGDWRWDGRYFCRSMAWKDRTFDHNCQSVARDGDVIRFRSDQGTGDWADLTLR
ncbi:MAG: dihydrodipicolinate reductase [Pseudooceanicola atlanticus]